MKKILTLLVLVISINSFSQLEVKEISGEITEIYTDAAGHVIRMAINEKDTSYVFLFRNAKYSKDLGILPIDLKDKVELIQFIDLMTTALKNGHEYETRSYRIIQGTINKSITVLTPNGHFYISEKWLDKINEKLVELKLK